MKELFMGGYRKIKMTCPGTRMNENKTNAITSRSMSWPTVISIQYITCIRHTGEFISYLPHWFTNSPMYVYSIEDPQNNLRYLYISIPTNSTIHVTSM
jgi:hypothetical protein